MAQSVQQAVDAPARPLVTTRALVLGAALIPFNVYWVMMVEGIWHSGHPTCISLPWGAVFNIIVLLAVNVLLKRVAPRYALTQAEFVTVYAMVAIAIMLAGHDSLQLGVPNLSYGFWYANEANHWEQLFHEYLPRFLSVSDPRVLEPFYDGRSSLYEYGYWWVWLEPVLWWCAIVLAVGLVMIGINVLLRKQWTEREKLGYPIVQLPLVMTHEGGNAQFFSNGVLWLGIAAGALLDLYNGLHTFWPALPLLDVRHDGNHFIETWSWGRPWNAIGRVGIPLYPFLTALGFLIPLDLCFSMWFFFIFRKLLEVGTTAMPIRLMPGLPYLTEQTFGAWFVLFGYAMWVGRRHFAEIGRDLWRGRLAREAEGADPLSYRAAVTAIFVGLAFLIAVCLKAGMTLGSVLAFLAFVIVLHTTVTRVRAELGPPAHEMAGNINAVTLQVAVAGTRGVGARNLAIFPYFWWLSGRGYRTTPMPVQLESLKMAEVSGAEPRRLAVGMAIAFLLGGLFSYWSAIHLTYEHGTTALIHHNSGQWAQLASYIGYPQDPSWQKMLFMGVGGVATAAMIWLRTQFSWWPLHPAGYALDMVFGVEYFWSCLVIAWLVKWAILRWAGHNTYQRFLPFIFGVIIGEYCVGAFWSAVSVILQRPMYDFSPG